VTIGGLSADGRRTFGIRIGTSLSNRISVSGLKWSQWLCVQQIASSFVRKIPSAALGEPIFLVTIGSISTALRSDCIRSVL